MLGVLGLIVEQFPRVSVIEHRGQSITWYTYEDMIWAVGESFRQVLKKQKRLRTSQPLFQAIENVASRPTFGKGRESFVMLMGQYGGKDRVPILVSLLQDRELGGHAVYALRLLGAEEAMEAIRPFLESEKPWVRREARRYFEKINRNLEGAMNRSGT